MTDIEAMEAVAGRLAKAFEQFQDAVNAELEAFAKEAMTAAAPYLTAELEAATAEREQYKKRVREWAIADGNECRLCFSTWNDALGVPERHHSDLGTATACPAAEGE